MKVVFSFLFAIALSSCTITARTMRPGTVVYRAPPQSRAWNQPPPFAGAVWVGGYWAFDGDEWFWVDGHWEAPRTGYVYVRPDWRRSGRGWVFAPGAWRPRVHVQPPRGRVRVRVRAPAPTVHVEPQRPRR